MKRKLSALLTEGVKLSPRCRGCRREFGCFGELRGISSRNCRSREATAAPALPPVGLAARGTSPEQPLVLPFVITAGARPVLDAQTPQVVFWGQEQPPCPNQAVPCAAEEVAASDSSRAGREEGRKL